MGAVLMLSPTNPQTQALARGENYQLKTPILDNRKDQCFSNKSKGITTLGLPW